MGIRTRMGSNTLVTALVAPRYSVGMAMVEAAGEYRFEVPPDQFGAHLDRLIDVTIGSLLTFRPELPRGPFFLKYQDLRQAYDTLRTATNDLRALDRHVVTKAVEQNCLILVVFRCMVGLTPPELADMASEAEDEEISQGVARTQDQNARRGKQLFGARTSAQTQKRLRAMIDAARTAIENGPTTVNPVLIHRLDKIDTQEGLASRFCL